MAYGKSTYYGLFPNGFRLMDGQWLTRAFAKVFEGGLSRQDGITAHAGGTKAAAFQFTKSINRVSVCANANDSALLPPGIAGSVVFLINSGAQTLAFYGRGTDTIDTNATATASTLAAGAGKILACLTNGAWYTVSAS